MVTSWNFFVSLISLDMLQPVIARSPCSDKLTKYCTISAVLYVPVNGFCLSKFPHYPVQKFDLSCASQHAKKVITLSIFGRSLFSPHSYFNRDNEACGLVLRPVRAIRVTRGGLEPSAIARGRPRRIVPTSLTGGVTSEIAEDEWERGCGKH